MSLFCCTAVSSALVRCQLHSPFNLFTSESGQKEVNNTESRF